MMSARVFKPIPLTDMPKMRSSSPIDGRYTYKDVMKVRRSLFNPDHEGTQRFLEKELAKDVAMHCKRWNFDFVTGRPCNNEGPYVWVPVVERQKIQTVIPQRPVKTYPRSNDDNLDLYPPIQTSTELLVLDEDERMSTDGDNVTPVKNLEKTPVKETPKKQSLITDFMQVRKRAEKTSTKKLEGFGTPRPTKIPRTTLTDPAS